MTILVKHRTTGNEYILLAVNALNGGGKINLPSRFLNDLFSQNETENYGLVTICDARGNIFLSYIDDLIVSEIDGKKPSEILPEIIVSSVSDEGEEDNDNLDRLSSSSEGDRALSSSETANISDNDDFEDDEDWV
ncbi:hypothetical protein [Myxosarcina sp. GI1(2024)]